MLMLFQYIFCTLYQRIYLLKSLDLFLYLFYKLKVKYNTELKNSFNSPGVRFEIFFRFFTNFYLAS